MVESISKVYHDTKFSPSLLKRVRRDFESFVQPDGEIELSRAMIEMGNTKINFKNTKDDEAEFYDKYSENVTIAILRWGNFDYSVAFELQYIRFAESSKTTIEIKSPSFSQIHEAFSSFDNSEIESRESFSNSDAKTTSPSIFLGHGRSQVWRDLRDHLRDHHGYNVVAYETGARAGHTIRDIVEDMASKSDMAFLVHTAEDELQDGSFQTRPNVIHETGLFQGRLGYSRAIVLLEQGCEEFSNLAGIQQIRFSKSNIRETFGDVLATLRREFGDKK